MTNNDYRVDHNRYISWHREFRPSWCPICDWEVTQSAMRMFGLVLFIPAFLVLMLFAFILISKIFEGRFF